MAVHCLTVCTCGWVYSAVCGQPAPFIRFKVRAAHLIYVIGMTQVILLIVDTLMSNMSLCLYFKSMLNLLSPSQAQLLSNTLQETNQVINDSILTLGLAILWDQQSVFYVYSLSDPTCNS